MLLLIDAGNTRIKWAAAAAEGAPGRWLGQGAVAHAALAQVIPQWRGFSFLRTLVSNVAGAAIAAQIAEALAAAGVRPESIEWFRSTPSRAGVTNGYHQPAQLGCDRFASLLGASHRYPGQALLVVTCGTATTIDALDTSGRFNGGMILPGLGTMATSLALNTAQLPAVAEAAFERVFADNTRDAIISGCLHAQVGAIAQAQAAMPGAYCLLSGGAAPHIAPHMTVPFEQVDQLVLLGLDVAARAEVV
jgi:type III pantothenate kinase